MRWWDGSTKPSRRTQLLCLRERNALCRSYVHAQCNCQLVSPFRNRRWRPRRQTPCACLVCFAPQHALLALPASHLHHPALQVWRVPVLFRGAHSDALYRLHVQDRRARCAVRSALSSICVRLARGLCMAIDTTVCFVASVGRPMIAQSKWGTHFTERSLGRRLDASSPPVARV